MPWIYLAALSYLITAVVVLVDKFLLASPPVKPFAYAFGIALLSAGAVVLIPFGVMIPVEPVIWVTVLGSGISSFIGIMFLYRALRGGAASLASAKVGAFTVIATYGFSLFLGARPDVTLHLPAIVLMGTGMFILGQLGKSIVRRTVISGVFLGLGFVLLKIALDELGFVNGVFWTRMAHAAVALAVLAAPGLRVRIIDAWRRAPRRTGLALVLNKILAGVGFFILYYAIEQGDVVTVTALQGLQFVFILGLALLFGRRVPTVSERGSVRGVLFKALGILLIAGGFLTLTI